MTRDEIKTRLNNIAEHAIHTRGEKPFILSLDDGIALKEAVEILSVEPCEIFDKIKAEIERERSFQRAMDEYDIATGLRKALEIIDRYTKSEEKNEDSN